jgi:plastocyanin
MKILVGSFLSLSLFAGCGQMSTSRVSSQTTQQNMTTEFHIAAGTGSGAWNTKDTMLTLYVGDTLKVINDDSVRHTMHTNGAPCPHGSAMAPNGGSYICSLTKTFDPSENGPLYAHESGPSAPFWIQVMTR